MDEFQCVDLSDTIIFSWVVAHSGLKIEVLASLWPDHPRYEEPPKSDYTCYRKRKLEFLGLKSVDGIAETTGVTAALDLDGTVDYGCFDYIGYDGKDAYLIVGEFGEVKLVCAEMRFHIY